MRQRVTIVAVCYIVLHLGNHLQYLAATIHDKGLMLNASTLPEAHLRQTHAFVYQALHLQYLILLHASCPPSGLLYFS